LLLSASNFGEPLTHTDALYFTVTVFSTTGFGEITAKTEAARLVVTAQMIADLLIIGLGLRVILGAVTRGLAAAARRRGHRTTQRVAQCYARNNVAGNPCRGRGQQGTICLLTWRYRNTDVPPHRANETNCAGHAAVNGASGHEKIQVCGQLAPGSRPSEFLSCGHLRSGWLAICSLPASGVS
jgi:hypothetical protein